MIKQRNRLRYQYIAYLRGPPHPLLKPHKCFRVSCDRNFFNFSVCTTLPMLQSVLAALHYFNYLNKLNMTCQPALLLRTVDASDLFRRLKHLLISASLYRRGAPARLWYLSQTFGVVQAVVPYCEHTNSEKIISRDRSPLPNCLLRETQGYARRRCRQNT